VIVLDFENDGNTTSLSQITIQFLLKFWNPTMACNGPSIYLSDASANRCVFVAPGQLRTMFVHIKVQCTNATLDNVIEVYPIGFKQSSSFLIECKSSWSKNILFYWC